MPIDTYREPVAYLPRGSCLYRPADFQALSKVEVRACGRHILAVLNVIDHDGWLMPDEVGVSALGWTVRSASCAATARNSTPAPNCCCSTRPWKRTSCRR